jgi:hypothetical protein
VVEKERIDKNQTNMSIWLIIAALLIYDVIKFTVRVVFKVLYKWVKEIEKEEKESINKTL